MLHGIITQAIPSHLTNWKSQHWHRHWHQHRHYKKIIFVLWLFFFFLWKKIYICRNTSTFFCLVISASLLFLSLEYSFFNCNTLWMNFKPHWPAELHTRSYHQLQVKQQVTEIRKFTGKIVLAYSVEMDVEKYFQWTCKLSYFKIFFDLRILIYSVICELELPISFL